VRSATGSVRAGFCGLDEFKFTPEKQALLAQHISISGPKGTGKESTLSAALRTVLSQDQCRREFCYPPNTKISHRGGDLG
jgi:hypothetical protein